MKRTLLFIATLFASISLISQAQNSVILQQTYKQLGLFPRITNSGIYSISSFDILNDEIFLRHFDSPMMTMVNKNNIKQLKVENPATLDLAIGFSQKIVNSTIQKSTRKKLDGNFKLKKSFLGGLPQLFFDDNGVITNSSGENILISVKNRNELSLEFNLSKIKKDFHLSFPSDLAYGELIGIDAKGNIFLLIERYQSEIPLNINRFIYTVSQNGNLQSILSVPMIKYCVTVKDFQIDSAGMLYHLMTNEKGIIIFRWSGLTENQTEIISYPNEYLFSEHYNNFLPTDEFIQEQTTFPLVGADRQFALRLSEQYVLQNYFCSANNLASIPVTASDGDIVQTPPWLIVGMNSRVGYKWGGFNTLAQYIDGLKSNKFAGDIHTDGVSSAAVGVDCSGFVSRCWQLSYHSATINMPTITTQYSSWDDLKPGDAIHKVGHVRLFVEKMPSGSLRVVEASARDWSTSYWSYAPSDLNGVYTPRFYNGMATEFSTNKPELLSVGIETDSTATLVWACDTTNVFGYRLYNSTDGVKWNLAINESTLHNTFISIPLKNSSSMFRVASVLRGNLSVESYWSNALSAGNFSNAKRILIIDGFERSTGSWRGAGHIFATRYGNALSKNKISFESVKNSQLNNSRFAFSNYNAIYFILGDESTEHETFSSTEQLLVQQYLESGGKIFISGSEIGWDLFEKGTPSDKIFYTNYLKAVYKSDDALSLFVNGVSSSIFKNHGFNIGQSFEEDYPDEIDATGGSTICFQYNNLKGAGIIYNGKFGSSIKNGKLIYLAFPLESTASDTSFNLVINSSLQFFDSSLMAIKSNEVVAEKYLLFQNYPNPFNSSTIISYRLTVNSFITLRIFDVLGRDVATLVNEEKLAGKYSLSFDGSGLPSGTYFYRIAIHSDKLKINNQTEIKKMLMIK